jgi:hypothetical protein
VLYAAFGVFRDQDLFALHLDAEALVALQLSPFQKRQRARVSRQWRASRHIKQGRHRIGDAPEKRDLLSGSIACHT